MEDIKKATKEINESLRKGEPANVSIDTYSGYSGYAPQHVIDTMNMHLFGKWGFEEMETHTVTSQGQKGESQLAVSKVQVWIAGLDFKPAAWGQSRVTKGDVGDAKKGAQTDAIKKALSYFSVGNRAYHGLLPTTKTK